MTAKLTASLREAPSTVPALAAIALFVVWATSQAGYPVTHWAPGAIAVLVLLAIALGLVRLRARAIPLEVRIALGALGAYTALSYLSILWAAVPGEAWEGANRTLLYLAVLALFACWRQRRASAALLLSVWTLALIALAAFTALHLDSASQAQLASMFPDGRLLYPSGYPNANAAQWLMAFWPAVLLARENTLPWALRGLLAGGAVLLAEVALLSQSRGSLYATPVVIVLVFALLPGRTRTFAVLAPVAAGIAAAAKAVLHVGDDLRHEAVVAATLHSAIAAMLAAAVAVAVIVALGAALDSRLGEHARRRARLSLRTIAAVALIAALASSLAAAGNPAARLESAWHSFKGGYGTSATTGSRLVSGLGSNRYDFYRVAIDEFLAHPLLGIGADNFAEQYLVHGRSQETPRYPHSVELRTLVETGLLGTLLALAGLSAALLAAARALRRPDPLVRTVASAALAGFGYWVVHGSFDWFWEFAGLGAPAFAMLGIACALAPARQRAARAPLSGSVWRRRAGVTMAAVAALAAVVSLGLTWFSQLELQSAARIWTSSPQTAYARLNDAAKLNPLSDAAYLLAGSIALRYNQLARAEHEFALALSRSHNDSYATLEQGAIASAKGEHARALKLLQRAVRLDPREPLTREAFELVRARRRIDVEQLNRSILLKAQQLA
jgi:O-antigen ligase